MKRSLLRLLLMLDAATLLIVGIAFIVAPARCLALFGFENAPANITFIVATFGVVYATMGIGTVLAAQSPVRNAAWVQVAIVRGIGECLVSAMYVLQGVVTWRQGGLTIVLPAAVAVGCLALYPKPEIPPPDRPAGSATGTEVA